MDVDTNASLIYGSGNNGRPEFSTAFPRTGTSRTRTNSNKSKYNGLQTKIDRRFRNGFMLTNSYTLSRSYDYVNENGTVSTPIDFEQSWGRSSFDRLHNYTLTGLYELPWGPNKRWLKEGLAGKLIGGWQLSGLFVAQSGVPLSITGSGTVLNTPGTTPYVNLNGDNRIVGGLGQGNLYFDPSVYTQPAAGVQGNMTRNSGPEGPGFWEIDSSLFKRFAISGLGMPNSGSMPTT